MTQTSPIIPTKKSEEILNLEQRIENVMESWKSTPMLVKKEFYARQLHEYALKYKAMTGNFFVRSEYGGGA